MEKCHTLHLHMLTVEGNVPFQNCSLSWRSYHHLVLPL